MAARIEGDLRQLRGVERIFTSIGAARGGDDVTEVYKIGQNTTRLLMSVGDLVIGWLLIRQAAVALAALDGASGDDVGFYQGKLAVARFFARTVLPELAARRRVLEATDNALMEIPDGAF